eukprot:TRINITY_DN36339_c0_g1_i2.p1 TRINITY_DN36339_c0_g1~~TRINITY_DN36339_c0_g1_i2.p1  ORF type:complete len:340 (-),score=84.99 TRINITY_DN36339_c0_g1_i2:16-1005(-)
MPLWQQSKRLSAARRPLLRQGLRAASALVAILLLRGSARPSWQCFSPQHYLTLHGDRKAVLELGCGDARVLRSLCDDAQEARVLMGLDLEPAFVSACKSLPGGIQAVQGDMSNFSFDRSFDAIIMPSSTLYCLGSEEQVSQCFKGVSRHLNEDGEFVFDAYNVDRILDEDWGWDNGKETFDSEFGCIVKSSEEADAFEMNKHLADEQLFVCRYTHVPKSPAGADSEGGTSSPVSYELRHRYLKSEQVDRLAEAAGLHVQSIAGGFDGEEFTPESARMVVTCRLASEDDVPVPKGWKAVDLDDYDDYDDDDDDEEEFDVSESDEQSDAGI